MNNGVTKNLIKSIGRLELTERIKGNSGTEFFPVELKLFHREERGDYLLGIEGKVFEQIRENLDLKQNWMQKEELKGQAKVSIFIPNRRISESESLVLRGSPVLTGPDQT